MRGMPPEIAMSPRQGGQALRDIEVNLTRSDPLLSELFSSFTERARGQGRPRAEQIRTGPLRLLARLGRQRRRGQPGEDWRAWPQTTPED
jgi:hypothetical protein